VTDRHQMGSVGDSDDFERWLQNTSNREDTRAVFHVAQGEIKVERRFIVCQIG